MESLPNPELSSQQTPAQPEVEDSQSVQVGSARIGLHLTAPPGTRVRVTLECHAPTGAVARRVFHLGPAPRAKSALGGYWGDKLRALTLDEALFGLAVLIYLASRLIQLPNFPIYFFTDEAVQTVLAQDFIRDGLRGYDGQFLPTYFQNFRVYNLGVSVYLQVLPYLVFGKSVWVTRGVSVLVTALAAVWVGLTLKQVFQEQFPWLGVLVLSVTPAWFLHSRTAFETALATTFYAGFMYFYLRYRTGAPRKLYPAVIMAALTFYSYNPARAVILATAAGLLALDARYHWQQRRVVLRALALTLLAALPLIRFEITHPGTSVYHLQQLNSYWIQPLPLLEKLRRYGAEFLRGLDPRFWYLSDNDFIRSRHVMKDYGHLPRLLLPFLLVGLARSLHQVRSAPYRVVLFTLFAAPAGAALAEIAITRMLTLVIPAALLTALGLAAVLNWMARRWTLPARVLAVGAFLALAGLNGGMLWDALHNGPTWSTSYGMDGIQYGARQVFAEIGALLRENPQQNILVSPNWANGTDVIARFFFDDPLPFEVLSIDSFIVDYRSLDDHPLVLMTPWEVNHAVASGKFSLLEVERTLFYLNGQPGFYFVYPQYVDNIAEIFAAERDFRRVKKVDTVEVQGVAVEVSYSQLDIGEIKNVFDGDPDTLIRTAEANPLVLEMEFPRPRGISGAQVRIGGEPTELILSFADAAGEQLGKWRYLVEERSSPRTVDLRLDAVGEVSSVKLLVRMVDNAEPAHVHLWELTLQ